MIALMDSGVQSLIVQLPGETSDRWPDVMKNLDVPGTRLAKKVACVRANFAPKPAAAAPSMRVPTPR